VRRRDGDTEENQLQLSDITGMLDAMPSLSTFMLSGVNPALYPKVVLQEHSRQAKPRRGVKAVVIPLANAATQGWPVWNVPLRASRPPAIWLRCDLLQWNNHCFKNVPCI